MRSILADSKLTFVQRFGDALKRNLHFHSIVLDGVYEHRQGDSPRFRRLPPPTDTDPATADPLPEDQPLLADPYAASVRSRIAMGDRVGLGVLRIGQLVDPEEAAFVTGRRCAMIDGVSLHANVAVPKGDRRRLEKLCSYIARPPVSTWSDITVCSRRGQQAGVRSCRPTRRSMQTAGLRLPTRACTHRSAGRRGRRRVHREPDRVELVGVSRPSR